MPHQESGIWSAGSRLPSASVRPSWVWIHYVVPWNEQFNKVIPFVCVSHAYSRASLAPTIQIFYRCLRGCSMWTEKKKKKSVSDASQEAKSVQPMFNALGVCWFLACTHWKVYSIKWVWEAQLLKKYSSFLRCRTTQTTSLVEEKESTICIRRICIRWWCKLCTWSRGRAPRKCCPAEPAGSKGDPETIHLTLV